MLKPLRKVLQTKSLEKLKKSEDKKLEVSFQTYYSFKKYPELPIKMQPATNTGWWFQIFFIFTPAWGNDPI